MLTAIFAFFLSTNVFSQKPKWIYQPPTSPNNTFYYSVGFGEAHSESEAKINAMAYAYWKAAQARGLDVELNDLKKEIAEKGIWLFGNNTSINIPINSSCTYSEQTGGIWKAWVLCQIARPGYFNPKFKQYKKCNLGQINNSGALARSLVIPGWGQKYKGRNGAAIWIFTSEIAALTVAGWSYSKAHKLKNDIKNAGTTDAYDLTLKYNKWKDVNNISLAVAAIIHGINLTTALTMRDNSGTSYSIFPSIDTQGNSYANLIIKF